MKIIFPLIVLISASVFAQSLTTGNEKIDAAFRLAVKTVDTNTRNGILAAGADYGGEWTRDISINSWNCASLLRPEVAEKSLWSVTINKDTIGHQYWDKIIWVIGALNHYKVTGNKEFLKQSFICSANTIAQLENTAFDKSYGLFTGGSVFNDGIAGYPMPIYDSTINNSSVLAHPTQKIKCLSTNCVYYAAYLAIYEMAGILKESGNDVYLKKAEELKFNILKNFYNADEHKFSYVIDQYGKLHHYQEGLGNSFAILFGIIDENEAAKVIENIHISDYGLASIYPDFDYFTPDKPGRHNNIVWPFINGFWSLACKKAGRDDIFYNELKNLASLAIDEDNGNGDFREIYNPYTGKPDGGWQLGSHWESCHHQTWSATAYIAMVLKGIAGMNFEKDGIYFTPYVPEGLGSIDVKDIHYRDAVLNIKISGSGSAIKEFKVNGTLAGSFTLPADLSGTQNIEIVMQ